MSLLEENGSGNFLKASSLRAFAVGQTLALNAAHNVGATSIAAAHKTSQAIETSSQWIGLLRAAHKTLKAPPRLTEKRERRGIVPLSIDHEFGEVSIHGQPVTYAKISNDNSFNTIVMTLGYRERAADYQTQISEYISDGRNVIALELPEGELGELFADGTEIDQAYEDIVSETILNPQSPLLQDIPDSHSVTLVSHSISGQAFERAVAHHDVKANVALDTFDHIYHTAIMLDTAHSSIRFDEKLSKIYSWYSSHENVRGQIVGETYADHYWIKDMLGLDLDNYAGTGANPTHGEAYLFKHGGIKLVDNILEGRVSTSFSALPRTFIMGAKDPSSCALTAKLYGEKLGAHVEVLDEGEHNPFTEYPSLRDRISNETVGRYFGEISELPLNPLMLPLELTHQVRHRIS